MTFTANVAANGLLPDLGCFSSLKEGRGTGLCSRPQGQGGIFICLINSEA